MSTCSDIQSTLYQLVGLRLQQNQSSPTASTHQHLCAFRAIQYGRAPSLRACHHRLLLYLADTSVTLGEQCEDGRRRLTASPVLRFSRVSGIHVIWFCTLQCLLRECWWLSSAVNSVRKYMARVPSDI
jgi:hypothetical protein